MDLGAVVTIPGKPGTVVIPGRGQGTAPVEEVEIPCPMVGVKCQGPRDGHDTTNPVDPTNPVAAVTLRDLINFRPVAGIDHMEPNGWMVVGLDTNFYAEAGAQMQDGQLLGQPASVRFSPLRYHWSYGDGASATSAAKGAAWSSQGIQEFDATPTSHIYRAPGTYTINLTIDFRADYRFGVGGWTPIAGTIGVPANRLVATAGDAKTVLVDKDCAANPSGPGC
ncbi:hypothetical protein [Glaciihabitans sp. UYNi722]|uniref:PKD domain-containing protein n=1 Tax=Glaciihabitans sp. UYNi722 TaxID=3156344 RepID=UPI00339B5127